jgi:hypothetical protein
MIALDAQLFGDEAFVRSLYGYPKALRRRMLEAVGAAARAYEQAVTSNELSGGVLNFRSSKLRRSMVTKVKETPGKIEAIVYPKKRYGWMLGQGTPKSEVTVRAHLRYVEGAGKASVVSRAYKKIGKKTWAVDREMTAESSVPVKSHPRRMLLAKKARPFMGPAYQRMAPFIEKRLRSAVLDARADMMEGLNIEETRGRS